MRFMMFIKHPADYAGSNPPQALYDAMGEFVGEQMRRGVFIDGAGLQPLAKGFKGPADFAIVPGDKSSLTVVVPDLVQSQLRFIQLRK